MSNKLGKCVKLRPRVCVCVYVCGAFQLPIFHSPAHTVIVKREHLNGKGRAQNFFSSFLCITLLLARLTNARSHLEPDGASLTKTYERSPLCCGSGRRLSDFSATVPVHSHSELPLRCSLCERGQGTGEIVFLLHLSVPFSKWPPVAPVCCLMLHTGSKRNRCCREWSFGREEEAEHLDRGADYRLS